MAVRQKVCEREECITRRKLHVNQAKGGSDQDGIRHVMLSGGAVEVNEALVCPDVIDRNDQKDMDLEK
jgi:hypothetical protein